MYLTIQYPYKLGDWVKGSGYKTRIIQVQEVQAMPIYSSIKPFEPRSQSSFLKVEERTLAMSLINLKHEPLYVTFQ